MLDGAQSRARSGQEGRAPGFEDTIWFRMDIGRRHNADPRWLLPLLCRRGHITKNEIGAIRIAANETMFEMPAAAAARFADAVKRTRAAIPRARAASGSSRPGHAARGREGDRRSGPPPARHKAKRIGEACPASLMAVRILVDADACPVKEEIYKVAYRLEVPVAIVSTATCACRSIPGRTGRGRLGLRCGDDWIAEAAGPQTVVVTADILLADRCIKRRSAVISPPQAVHRQLDRRGGGRRGRSWRSSRRDGGRGLRTRAISRRTALASYRPG
jgi:uncharacterized protein YaiI (UPF0178 family)